LDGRLLFALDPIAHSNEFLSEHEALSFFGPAMNAIHMMLGEIKGLMDTNKTPILEGLQLEPEEIEIKADPLGLLPGNAS
jgi:hypothetical protein